MENNLQIIEQKIKAADATFEAAQALLRDLRTSWEDGSLEITKDQLWMETERLEENIGNLLVVKAVMRTSKFQLAGRQVDIVGDGDEGMEIFQIAGNIGTYTTRRLEFLVERVATARCLAEVPPPASPSPSPKTGFLPPATLSPRRRSHIGARGYGGFCYRIGAPREPRHPRARISKTLARF
ncbi:hypothetical protein GGR51DRAFT_565598 [Nemania sp. FL0031]|nr:hypothetical protein GGR51DRAFT_565598 [Nemania sp. FL0031]